MSSHQDVSRVSEAIWRQWNKAAEGRGSADNPCSDCPVLDQNMQYRPKNIDPGWHSGCPDADVMLVGLEPSDSYSDEETSWPSDYESYYDEATNKDIHGFLFYDTDSSGSSFINRSFIDTLKGEIYYTNSQKCGYPPNPEARRNCVTYLSMQIEAIDPDVVISLGKNTTDVIRANIEDSKLNSADSYYELVLHQYGGNSGRTIIPSYHWSYFDRSDDPVPHHLQTDHDIQNVEHYWETVAELSNKIIKDK